MAAHDLTVVDSPASGALSGASAALTALGRVLICLDRDLQVLHVSALLDTMLGSGSRARFLGRPISELLGDALFGPGGSLRQALLAGERREGWRALVEQPDGAARMVGVSVAPLSPVEDPACIPGALFFVEIRPAEDEPAVGGPILFAGLIARSAQMGRVVTLVQDLAESDATVLLTGETGVGKEVVAHAIHAHSSRRIRPFVAVNCGALPGELIESELFGHVRGAIPGALRDRVGRVESAAGGTLFLDEIGDVPPSMQVKLLRILQDRTFERLGETRSRRADVRIIAATDADLRRAVQEGRFREDLYHRLRVVPVEIPPLRERREDIEPLAQFLLGRVGAREGRALRFSPDTLRVILQYPWPGNVRELENALEYAVAVCRDFTVLPQDLPAEVQCGALEPGAPSAAAAVGPGQDIETERLLRALETHRWSRRDTARALGISRTTLWRLMRDHGLQTTQPVP